MQIGMVGLGKMGGPMAERLLKGKHRVVVTNRDPKPIAAAEKKGAVGAENLSRMVQLMEGRRAIWLMIPSGEPVENAIKELTALLTPGDIIIDGGNSFYKDTVRRAEFLKEKGLHYIDSGTSGGIWGLSEGYCLMVGGEPEPVSFVEPAFRTLAPEEGYLHCGPSGSGHFVKMVHNGIEYAMMAAYGEGFEILAESPFALDLKGIAEVWRHGSVVRSWLLDLTASALKKDPQLDRVKQWVSDSGEGRWTVQQAVDTAVPAYTIAASLFSRFASRHENAFGLRLQAALRNEFGGHAVKPADGNG